MKKSFLLLLLILLLFIGIGQTTYAQNYPKNPNQIDASQKRQGKWTVFFDADWDVVPANSDRIKYYRLIEYKDDKPVGIVKDYYLNGTLQFEGILIADRPEEIKDGICTFYNNKGQKTMVVVYQNTKRVSTTYFDKNGNPTQESFDQITSKGDELYEDNKYKEALVYYEKAQKIAEGEEGKVSENYATALTNIAFARDRIGEGSSLEPLYKEIVQIREQTVGKKSRAYVEAIYNLGYFYANELNDLPKAEALYLEGYQTLQSINKKESNTYYYLVLGLADLYETKNDYAKALPFAKEAVAEIEKRKGKDNSTYTRYLYQLAKCYKKQNQYAEANKLMDEVITTNAQIIAKKYKTNPQPVRIVKNMPNSIKKTNLGTNINTKYSELAPFITADGKTLYFDTKYSPQNTGGVKDPDEIYYAELQPNGTWGKAQNIGKPLNNASPNAIIAVTPDNNTALVIGTYKSDGSWGGSGLSIAQRTAEGWGVPQKVEVRNYKNKSKYVDYNLSADGKTLISAAEGEGSLGDMDLYVSFLQPDGSFSEPLSLGKTINTPARDSSPFLAPDGVTLYYSTSGLPSYGGTDIFVTKRLDDTWQNWSEPENLGHEINTKGEDAYFVIPASGKYAYMVSSSESIGEQDIVQLELPAALRPNPVVLITGRVLNAKTKQPLTAKITYRDLETDKELGIANASPIDGTYKIVLPLGNAYSFLAEKKGFIATSNNLNLEKLTTYKEIQQDLLLSPIEAGQTIRLNNIFFDTDKFQLKDESAAELNRLVKLLNENPTMEIEIMGHTDAVGIDQKNLILSQNRADAVKNYLLSKGVTANRLQSKGYGKTRPVADNTTEEGRQQNRRVEFNILK